MHRDATNSAHIRQSRPDSGLAFRQKSLIDSGLVGSTDFHSSHPQGHEPVGGVPREQKMLKGHLPRVISPSILNLIFSIKVGHLNIPGSATVPRNLSEIAPIENLRTPSSKKKFC